MKTVERRLHESHGHAHVSMKEMVSFCFQEHQTVEQIAPFSLAGPELPTVAVGSPFHNFTPRLFHPQNIPVLSFMCRIRIDIFPVENLG